MGLIIIFGSVALYAKVVLQFFFSLWHMKEGSDFDVKVFRFNLFAKVALYCNFPIQKFWLNFVACLHSRINSQGGIKWPTQFRLNVKSVDILNIEEVRADVPMTLSVRNVNQLLVKHSYFEKIAWPGFYIFNITSVAIKENAFPDIASRSIVAKKGKQIKRSKFIVVFYFQM